MNIKGLKLNKGEDVVYVKAVNGKANFYVKHQRYIRLIKSDIDMTNTTVSMSSTDFKMMTKRMELVKLEKLIVNDCAICINDTDNINNSFCYRAGELPDFISSGSEFVIFDVAFMQKIKATRSNVSTKENRHFLEVYHFTEDGKCIATNGRTLSCVRNNSNLENLLEMCDGNIFAEVFDCFNGKKEVKIAKCNFEGTSYLKFTDGVTEVYTPANANVLFPKWERVVPEITENHQIGTITNLKSFKKLLSLLKPYNYNVLINNDDCYTLDSIKLCQIGDVLNGYKIRADFLAIVAELFGNSTTCTYRTDSNDKVIVFGDMSADFILAMPSL